MPTELPRRQARIDHTFGLIILPSDIYTVRVGHNFLGSRSHPCRAPRFLLARIFSSKKLLTSMISYAPGASLPSYSACLLLLRSQLLLLQKSSKRLCLALDWKHLSPKGERKLIPYRNAGTGESSPWAPTIINSCQSGKAITNKSPEQRVTRQKFHLLSQFLWFLRFQSEFKCQIASEFEQSLLNTLQTNVVSIKNQ